MKNPRKQAAKDEKRRKHKVAVAMVREATKRVEAKRMPPIQVWRFEDAPEELRQKSTNGGDEDWIALVPAEYYEEVEPYLPWLEEGHGFGYCSVDVTKLLNGDYLYIGSHA